MYGAGRGSGQNNWTLIKTSGNVGHQAMLVEEIGAQTTKQKLPSVNIWQNCNFIVNSQPEVTMKYGLLKMSINEYYIKWSIMYLLCSLII